MRFLSRRIFAALFCLSFLNIAKAETKNGFYVWQRAWNEKVDAAVVRELETGDHELYLLAGEVEYENGSAKWKEAQVPASLWTKEKVTAVFRLPIKTLDEPKDSAALVIEKAKKLKVNRLQLDVDVPESKLGKYEELIKEIRGTWPSELETLKLGATFLPCHLSHGDLPSILALLEEPILQLHGIDPPRSRKEKWALMNRRTSLGAIKAARKLDSRFKLALPTYAYVLSFNKDGSFRRLFAEGLSEAYRQANSDSLEIAAPDLELLKEILSAPDSPKVLWFRLPIEGLDRWALEKETILELERGNLPKPSLDIELVCVGPKLVDIKATYHNQIPLHSSEVRLEWGEEKRGEFYPMNGTEIIDDSIFGVLPGVICVAPFPSGQTYLIGKVIKETK